MRKYENKSVREPYRYLKHNVIQSIKIKLDIAYQGSNNKIGELDEKCIECMEKQEKYFFLGDLNI